MPNNGEPEGTLEEILENLTFPNTLGDEECEAYRQQIRDNPSLLRYLVDVPDLYDFVMGTVGPETETKELFVRGLRYYLQDQALAYAVMVRLYTEEVHEILLLRHRDPDGCDRIREHILEEFHTFAYPADGMVH